MRVRVAARTVLLALGLRSPPLGVPGQALTRRRPALVPLRPCVLGSGSRTRQVRFDARSEISVNHLEQGRILRGELTGPDPVNGLEGSVLLVVEGWRRDAGVLGRLLGIGVQLEEQPSVVRLLEVGRRIQLLRGVAERVGPLAPRLLGECIRRQLSGVVDQTIDAKSPGNGKTAIGPVGKKRCQAVLA